MSRQRLRPSLGESSYHTCPRCSGFGTIRSVESLALAILRIVGEEARKERTVKVIAQLPVEVATYLLNEKRDWVQNLEARHDTQVVLIANPALETPHYDIRRVRDDQADLPENAGASYALAEAEQEIDVPSSIQERKVAEQAAIGKIEPTTPAPQRPEPAKPGFWGWLKSLFGGGEEESGRTKAKARKKEAQPRRRGRKGDEEAGRERGKAQRARRSEARSKDEGPRSKKKTKKKSKKKARKKVAATDTAEQGLDGKQPSQEAADSGKDELREDGRRGSRSRRSRGGRRSRRSPDKASQDTEPQQSSAKDPEKDTKQAPDADKRAEVAAERAAKVEAEDRPSKQDNPVDDKPQGANESRSEAQRSTRPGSRAEKKPADKVESQSIEKPADKTANPSEKKPADRTESPPEKKAAREPESQAEKKSGNGSERAIAAAGPEGRLLPWEPAHLPAKIRKDEPAEPRREADSDDQNESSSRPSDNG